MFDETYEALPAAARRAYRARVIARHVALILEHCSTKYALIQLKKHLAWYSAGLPGSAALRPQLFAATSAAEALERFWALWTA